MVKEEDILEAYQNCLSDKASSPDAIRFIVNLFENITDLTDAINSRTYEPLPSITFVVSRPVYREVFAANFRDRVIHHYIALRLEPLFEGVFSDRTYNCRKGKRTAIWCHAAGGRYKGMLRKLHSSMLVSEMRHERILYEHTPKAVGRQGR